MLKMCLNVVVVVSLPYLTKLTNKIHPQIQIPHSVVTTTGKSMQQIEMTGLLSAITEV